MAVLVALPVHAVSLAFAVGGVVLLATGATWPLKACGVLLILAAVSTRPRVARTPDHVSALHRQDAPILFGLLDDVAASTGAPVPRVVVVDEHFNAFATRVGWRRTPVIGIGAPLWVPATPQGRVALLAHELGHFAHGDLTHGRWVSGAQQSLLHWVDVLTPLRHVTYDALVGLVHKLLFAPLRWTLIGYLLLIGWVSAPARQRQEYLADLDAVTAAGTDGAVDMLDLVMFEPTVSAAITRAAVSGHRPDVWHVVTAAVAEITEESRERQRAHASSVASRIDDSHPATALRLRLVHNIPHREASLVLDPERCRKLDAELADSMARAAKSITDRARS